MIVAALIIGAVYLIAVIAVAALCRAASKPTPRPPER